MATFEIIKEQPDIEFLVDALSPHAIADPESVVDAIERVAWRDNISPGTVIESLGRFTTEAAESDTEPIVAMADSCVQSGGQKKLPKPQTFPRTRMGKEERRLYFPYGSETEAELKILKEFGY